mmetsp:Transcript_27303/g.62895  ORF Transcript_27303/g.62895 Transcript_27303/m.62895 type:complete len:116 (+) Transcript_27303:265-612(+)
MVTPAGAPEPAPLSAFGGEWMPEQRLLNLRFLFLLEELLEEEDLDLLLDLVLTDTLFECRRRDLLLLLLFLLLLLLLDLLLELLLEEERLDRDSSSESLNFLGGFTPKHRRSLLP